MCNITNELEILNEICPLYTNGTSKRPIRHDFFKNIKTEIQAYLLGFYVADGSLNLQRNTIRIKVSKIDSEIIDLFQNYISPEAYTKLNKSTVQMGTNNKEITIKETYQIDISSIILSNSLQSQGYGEGKTYLDMSMPKIAKNLIPHFIRGYFDGDGWLTYAVRKPNPNNREKNYRVSATFGITSKTKTLLLEIQQYFKEVNIKTNINYVKSSDTYRLCCSSRKEICKIFNHLYNDSKFYLLRKFNKFNYYANTEVSQIITDHRNA